MSFARSFVVLVLLLVVGIAGYQIGIDQNIAAQVPAATGAVPPYYWYGPHMFGFGFGFLGLLFPLFFLFLIFGLIRAAIWGGRGYGGHGYGWQSRRERFEAMHREVHGEKPATADHPGDR